MRLRSIFALLLTGAVAGAGCAPSERQVEQAVERELPRLVGPAESYDVDIQGLRGTRGADRVDATGRRVRPEGSPTLDRVDVTLNNVTYNAGRGQLERIESAEMTARVRAADLAAFLDAQRNLRDVTVSLSAPDRATVQARPEITGLEIPQGATIAASGRLLAQGAQVRYAVDEARAAGVALPAAVPRRLTEAINPLVDLSGMPVVLQITETRVEGDTVILRATGRYPRQ